MKRIQCSGTPFEIGLEHGRIAKTEVGRCLDFYRDLFLKTAALSWSEVCDTAVKFDRMLQNDWPDYCEEMRGEHMICISPSYCAF